MTLLFCALAFAAGWRARRQAQLLELILTRPPSARRIARHARRTVLRLARDWPWSGELAAAFACLQALPPLAAWRPRAGP